MEQQAALALQGLESPRIQLPQSRLPWIETAKKAPYFVTDTGIDWTPVGQNDALTWPDLQGAFLQKDLASADAYFRMLAAHGVTCLRLMLEYCQGEHRYFEKPAGRFQPNMIRLWDDLFLLCEKWGLRLLLTPYDTFWMWRRWRHHPYKRTNGGPCDKRNRWLLCPDMRNAIKQRLAFATQRWGGSGALFAWDLWNEIHPAHAGNRIAEFGEFISDVGGFLRQTELKLHGRAHLQTVSLFGPELQKHPDVADCIFRHPQLDFASLHFYEKNTIDHPKNTLDAAISTGRLTREALQHIKDARPFLDSEHGPIHTFKDHRKTLPAPFDDEYFRHMQWAHLASGGAGGGMRWPNRHPHTLTPGMRQAQHALARFLPLIDWQRFQRRNLNAEIKVSTTALAPFACGDREQAIAWVVRSDTLDKKRMLSVAAAPVSACVCIPGFKNGTYGITTWDTRAGIIVNRFEIQHVGETYLRLELPPFHTDLAIAVRRMA